MILDLGYYLFYFQLSHRCSFWLIIAVESEFKKVHKQNEQIIELLKRIEEKGEKDDQHV
ncbi:MAG: hypothetical protein ACQEWV_28155 [Bacillota bacterium]